MNGSVSTLQKAEREIVIDFPMEKVKAAIMEMFTKFPTKYVLSKNGINETFNTYRFIMMNGGLNSVVADITLQSTENEKTKISLVITNTYGSISSTSILSGVANDYLLVLGKVLSGENDEEIKKAVGKDGCIYSVLVAIIMIAIIVYFVFL